MSQGKFFLAGLRDRIKIFTLYQNDSSALTAVRRMSGSYATRLGSTLLAVRSVSAIFQNWERLGIRVAAAVAMATFAVEPQAPTLGELKTAFPRCRCYPRDRPGAGQDWKASVSCLLYADFSCGGGASGSPQVPSRSQLEAPRSDSTGG